ncbi:S8 family serine peptidase [Paraburkholderia sp. Se-20369]|nr:S8 family serine peptidase [Paraburkholderia sp. Se-20369]
MRALDLVKLSALMEMTSGRPSTVIGLIDGPVATDHPDFALSHIRIILTKLSSTCAHVDSVACQHGTFVAGILSAQRGSSAPAICPGCTLLIHPIFAEDTPASGGIPSAMPEALADTIIECVRVGAHVLNISAAIAQPSSKGDRALQQALDYAAKRGTIVVGAAGNQGTLGSTAITRHAWVIPVASFDLRGRPMDHSNLGNSVGRGVGAPGDRITSLSIGGKPLTFGGTSVATPFVTGAIALLWSEFPNASAAQIKLAITRTYAARRSVVPPLLNVWGAYQSLLTTQRGGGRL